MYSIERKSILFQFVVLKELFWSENPLYYLDLRDNQKMVGAALISKSSQAKDTIIKSPWFINLYYHYNNKRTFFCITESVGLQFREMKYFPLEDILIKLFLKYFLDYFFVYSIHKYSSHSK